MLRKIVLFSLLILSATYFVLQKSGYFTTYTGLNRIDQIADYNTQGYGTPDSGKTAKAPERSGRDLPVHAAAKNGQLEQLKQEVKNKENIEAFDFGWGKRKQPESPNRGASTFCCRSRQRRCDDQASHSESRVDRTGRRR